MPCTLPISTRPRAFVTLDGSTIRELAGRVSLPTEQPVAGRGVGAGRPAPPPSTITSVSEELYFFTAGSGHLRVGDEYRDVRAGDCVVIAPGAIHKLTNTGDEPLQAAVLLRAAVQRRRHRPNGRLSVRIAVLVALLAAAIAVPSGASAAVDRRRRGRASKSASPTRSPTCSATRASVSLASSAHGWRSAGTR